MEELRKHINVEILRTHKAQENAQEQGWYMSYQLLRH